MAIAFIFVLNIISLFEFSYSKWYGYLFCFVVVVAFAIVIINSKPHKIIVNMAKNKIDKRQKYMVGVMVAFAAMDIIMTFINYSYPGVEFSSFELNKMAVALTYAFGKFGFILIFLVSFIISMALSWLMIRVEKRYNVKSHFWKVLPAGNAIGFASNVVGFILLSKGIM